jgi:transposase
MDLGSESVQYCVMKEGGKIIKEGRLSWKAKEWKAWVEEYGAENLEVAFESGPESHEAERRLKGFGIRTHPFHAKSFRGIWCTKKKSDRIDAKKIAKALLVGGLPPRVELPGVKQARVRNLLSERTMHHKITYQLKDRVRGLARQWGVTLPVYDDDKAEVWWQLALKRFPKSIRPEIGRLYRTSLAARQAMEELDEELPEAVEKAGYSENARRVDTLPGIGPVAAWATAAYLGDGKRFTSGRKYGGYTGLVPSLDDTGKQTGHLGKITKEGPAILRWLYVQAARNAVRSKKLKGTRWQEWFDETAKRRGRKRAIVGLARKLATACYALVRDETEYEPERLAPRKPILDNAAQAKLKSDIDALSRRGRRAS